MHRKIITSLAGLVLIALGVIFFSTKLTKNPQQKPTPERAQSNGLHIGIIMDGNRRWANKKGQSSGFGHKEGANVAQEIIKHANKIGVEQLTLYALSIENLKRSKTEVETLLNLSGQAIKKWPEIFGKENIKIQFFGDQSLYAKDLLESIKTLEKATEDNTGLNLNILFCYGGEQEIAAAIKTIAQKINSGEMSAEEVNSSTIAQHCWTGSIGSPDLIIRTGGQQRMSNFMPLASTYSEIMFVEKYWPDFTDKDLTDCINKFNSRKRTFGI